MREPVRIGAVNYLNTKPLIHDLDALAPAGGADARRAQPAGRPTRRRRTRCRPDPGHRVLSRRRRYTIVPGHRHRHPRPGAERDAVQPRAVAGDSPGRARRRLADQRRADAGAAARNGTASEPEMRPAAARRRPGTSMPTRCC